jgi:rare lipoprotein A (peptidoglycan hydrolase)
VTPRLAQREFALAAVALLAVVVSLAVASYDRGSATTQKLPQPVAVPGGWYSALAARRLRERYGTRTACGEILTPDTLGVSHPVLPCGAKLFLRFGDKEVLTQVIDRGPSGPGHEFDLTSALARRLDLHGTQLVRWTFARG